MPNSTDAGPRRGLTASLTATIGANLPVFLTASLAVRMQDDLRFGDAALGVAVGAYYAAGAVSSPYAGRAVARLGARASLRNAAIMSAVAQLTIATAVHSYWLLLVVVSVGGVANAWAQPASNVYLMAVVPSHRLGLALGVQKSAIPAAALIGGLAVPFTASAGWRWAFVAGAAFALVSAIQVPPTEAGPNGTLRPAAGRSRVVSLRPDTATRSLVVLAIGVGLGSSASNALSGFLVRGGVEAGLGETSAAVLLVIGSIIGIAVRLALGARADRSPGRTLALMVWLFLAAAVAFALLATEHGTVFAIGTPLAFATGYAWPGLFHLAVVRSNPSAPAAATGIAMTGTLAGAVLGPVLFGALADHVSFTAAWLCGSGMLLTAAAVVLVADRHIVELPVPTVVQPQPIGRPR
jgi:predicted MFS family arabinose efflux permease